MDLNDDEQKEEIFALKSTFDGAFIESAPPKAWKGAARQPEYNLVITHGSVSFHLNVKYPKAYPSKAAPIVNIVQPIVGLNASQLSKLNSIIHDEATKNIGLQSVYLIADTCRDWLRENFKIPSATSGSSLAVEMAKRSHEEEKLKKETAESKARAEDERMARQAEELRQQIEEDALRKEQLQRQEKERHRARRRALSDATEKPYIESATETFDREIEAFGLRFDTVRLFHGRQECLGTTYSVEPLVENGHISVPLELHVVLFHSNYYSSNLGRKKLLTFERETQTLTKIKHANVMRVYAVQVTFPKSSDPVKLAVLLEKKPTLTLHDLLQDCDSLREDRVSDYLSQTLAGLNAIHSEGLIHRGINPSSIGLVDREGGGKTVKLMKVAFYTTLHDMHKSDPFASNLQSAEIHDPLPVGWLTSSIVEKPLEYTRSRDIHNVGIVLLQMLMGLDVMGKFPDPVSAIQASSISPTMFQLASDIFVPSKKGVASCLPLLAKLSQLSLSLPPKARALPIEDNQTPMPRTFPSSPENTYFRAPPPKTRQASRWREDWEELEMLGKGGFGSVVKAKNKLDGRIYAVKKIKLVTTQRDNKIFREVNALSRLSHRFIVRYYTTWLEETESNSSNASSDSENSDTEEDKDEHTAGVKEMNEDETFDPFSYDLDELNLDSRQKSNSFPSILFTNGDVVGDSSDEDDEDPAYLSRIVKESSGTPLSGYKTPPKPSIRTLYIQMEYVERQTLRERIAEGISEDEAWRLFQQIVDALVHMSGLGILHRDIKLTNIFIDCNGDCKVGDFGLATSSLAAVDPSDVSPQSVSTLSDMTLDVGTRLYIAPEVLSRRGGPRDHSKADIYSLGIVFFELNHVFSTASERIAVIEKLRLPDIHFPDDWDSKRTRQKSIIHWLLQHDPAERPSALQLSQSSLLPPRIEDEYFKEALQMMTKPDSPHYQSVLSALFSQPPRPSRGFLYDNDLPETASLRSGVVERLGELFRLHGAREVDVPLLMPLTRMHTDEQRQVLLLDRHGEIVTLPANALLPFARLAARTKTTRIKRFHISDTYRGGNVLGHPSITTAAIFDIITPDIMDGPDVSSAEVISIAYKCLCMFPNLEKNYEIHISHSKISEVVLERIPKDIRASVIDVLTQTKSSIPQRKAILMKKGLSKSMVDELELLLSIHDDWDELMLKISKHAHSIVDWLRPHMDSIKKTLNLIASPEMPMTILIKPLMIARRHEFFKDGVCFEIIRRGGKRNDILAVGGRYDDLISQFYPPLTKKEPFCAYGLQIAIERITSAIATFQTTYMLNVSREHKSYGFWSARRCDIYVVSFQSGQLKERLETATVLWQHGISADLMYESAVSETNSEALAELCHSEGILFTVYPRLKSAKRELLDYKVKSVLRGTEYEIPKQDLVPWLLQQIMEQKKVDLTGSGVATQSESGIMSTAVSTKEINNNADVQMILPAEGTSMKKQLKKTKQLFLDRAYETRLSIKTAMQTGSMPMFAVDVLPAVFDALSRSDVWVKDDEAWRSILSGFPTGHAAYANQIRDAVSRKKEEGVEFVLLFSVKEERVALLSF